MAKGLTKKQIENNDITTLTKTEQREITTLKNNIKLNYEGITSFGNEIGKKYNDFSNSLLDNMKLKDSPETEEILSNLLTQLDTIDTTKLMETNDSFLSRIFKTKDVKAITNKYKSVQDVINEAKKSLENSSYELKKDIELCEMHLKHNIEYIRELDKYIMASKMRLEEEKANIDKELLEVDQTDTYAVSMINQKQYEINRLERKVFDLMLKREASVQTIPQISIIRENDALLIEKIDSSISNAIPLWETHMIIAIQLMRQKNGLKISDAVSETTSKLLETNINLLKMNSVSIAARLEEGFIDYEVLQNVQQQLIETISEIKNIHCEGQKKREVTMAEIEQNNQKINEVQLLGVNNEV